MADHSKLGARLGPRIARVVVDAQADHLRTTGHHRARIEAEAKHLFWRDISKERDVHVSPLLRLLTAHEDHPDEVKRALGFMLGGQGELAGMLASRTLGTAAAQGIGAGLADLLAPINQRIMQERPNLTLAPSDAAQAVAAGIWAFDTGRDEAGRNGINTDRFGILHELAISYPDYATALELHRRGIADDAEVLGWLKRAGYTDIGARELLQLARVILAPPDLALGVLRGNISADDGRRVAAQSGVDAHDFDLLVENTGEPPGLEQLLEAYRRRFIDKARLDRGIRQSRVRNEWTDVVERLRFAPMQTADAVEAVVRNYISPAEGESIAEQNGLEPEHWQTLLLAHGRPPGLGQMLQLWNRGEASEEQVAQAIRESDVKDKYIGQALHLRYKIPAERLLVTLVKDGSLPVARAHELLQKEGYEADVADAIIKAGTSQRTAGHKQLALATVEQLYEAHAIDEATAAKHIEALGYPASDVPLILRVNDAKRLLRWRDSAIAAVRTGFLGHHTSEAEARAQLSNVGVGAEEIAHLLTLWVIERQAHRRSLTEAQIVHAMRGGHIDAAQAQSRLEGIGYGPNDALFLVETSGPLPKGA